ncbi:hypothetical protein [Acidiphilium angustum]|uniref:hypothetical protein n=1 Tax=Acidiphilium angustum TaxID=523 RepID=UPI0004941553|nr:hypothetical protein [Acidiphilium angustum]
MTERRQLAIDLRVLAIKLAESIDSGHAPDNPTLILAYQRMLDAEAMLDPQMPPLSGNCVPIRKPGTP